jgi:hypothetical protein
LFFVVRVDFQNPSLGGFALALATVFGTASGLGEVAVGVFEHGILIAMAELILHAGVAGGGVSVDVNGIFGCAFG